MKKETNKFYCCVQPVPKAIVSVRDKEGNNNALVVGFMANVSLDPAMVMIGIVPTRYSYHMVKENPCFVINFPSKKQEKEYNYLGSHSGRDEDKLKKLKMKVEDGKYVNAPVLSDCPISIECSVISSVKPGTHELFFAKVETIHADEELLDKNGNINWEKANLL